MVKAIHYDKYHDYAIEDNYWRNCVMSLQFLGCLTDAELRKRWFNGASVLRSKPMPHDPTLLEQHKGLGITPEVIEYNTRSFMARMLSDIRDMRKMRGVCPVCAQRLCAGGHS
jgi:hypothetical protein